MIYYNVTCPNCKKTMSEMFVRINDGGLKWVPCGLLCSCGYHEIHMDDVKNVLEEK